MFPFRGMPHWAQMIGEVFPLTHFLRIRSRHFLKGNGLTMFAASCGRSLSSPPYADHRVSNVTGRHSTEIVALTVQRTTFRRPLGRGFAITDNGLAEGSMMSAAQEILTEGR
jgi:hypothetical protein